MTFGIRTGPRVADDERALTAGTLQSDRPLIMPPELGVAFDFAASLPLGDALRLHLLAQAEVFFGLPLPAIGLGVGLSYRQQFGLLHLIPALSLRGGTDFGLSPFSTPTSRFSLTPEASLFIGTCDSTTAFGLIPFAALSNQLGGTSDRTFFMWGAVGAVRSGRFTFTAGFARVRLTAGDISVPLLGLQVGSQ